MALNGFRRAIAERLHRLAMAVADRDAIDLEPTREAAGFRGGRGGDFSGDWLLGHQSINSVIRADASTMKEKARDLRQNNASGTRFATLVSENVSGKDGILYQPTVLGPDLELNEPVNQLLSDGWYRWAEDRRAVTADERMTWQEVEQHTDEAEPVDGEVFVRLLPGFRNKWRFAVQVLDPDQIDVHYNVEARPGQNAIVMGIELNAWGAPVAYHIWPNHPSEATRGASRIRVPASQMIHSFMAIRPGQARGVTWYAPVLDDLMHQGRYREAEVIAVRMAASKMGFIKGSTGTAGKDERISAKPGRFVRLFGDEEFQEWNPQHPGANYDAFDRAIARSVSSGLRVSYMSFSGDLSQTSFASGQMGYLAEKNFWQTLQQRRIMRYSRPVLSEWLAMAIISGQLDVRGDLSQLTRAEWRARPFQPIDRLKDTKTNALELALGTTCLTDIVEANGGDLRTIVKKRKAEIALFKDAGVPLFLPVGSAIALDDDERDAQEREDSTSDAPSPDRAPSRAQSFHLERIA